MPASTITEVQYGVRYQNGTEDWNTQHWYGTIDIPESRETFREQYDLRMESFGMPKMSLEFLTRTVSVTYSDVTIIDDTAPAPEPEPAPEEEVPPVVEDEVPAAPGEDSAPPTDDAPVGEELPEDADDVPATDDEGVAADGK